jgi:hypothetical protein
MHWRGITVPPLYARMAVEFQDLVSDGEYAAWVAHPDGSAGKSRQRQAAGAL